MYLLVLKLLIRTRLSRAYLIFLVLLAVVDILLAVSGTGSASGIPSQSFVAAAFLVFIYFMTFTVVTLLGNGLGMTKPDSDFLLPSSLKGKTLNYALFTVQLISTSLIFIILSVAYSIELYHFSPVAAIFVANFAMLGFTLTSISVLVSDYGLLYRIPIFAGVSIFLFSFLLGFQYSPFEILAGGLYTATIGTAGLFAVSLFFGIRWVHTNDLYVKNPMFGFRKKETFKDRLIFVGLSPGKAIFRQYFTHFFSGRPIGMSGTVLAVSNRYRLRAVVPVFAVLSAILVVAIYYFKPPTVSDLYPVLIVFVIYLSFVVNLALYSTYFSVERLWLSAMSMPFHDYVRKVVTTQFIQTLVLDAPIGVAIAVLGFMYGFSLFPLLIAVLVITPEAVAVMSSLSIVARLPQAWENAIMTRRVGIKRMIYMVPYVMVMVSGLLMSIIYPLYAAAEAAILGVLIYLFITRKNYWEGMVSKLAEHNYI